MGQLMSIPKRKTKLRDLEGGQVAYNLPWGLGYYERKDGKIEVVLNVSYPAETQPGGTVKMKVKRTGRGPGDFDVWPEREMSLSGIRNHWFSSDEDIVTIDVIDPLGVAR